MFKISCQINPCLQAEFFSKYLQLSWLGSMLHSWNFYFGHLLLFQFFGSLKSYPFDYLTFNRSRNPEVVILHQEEESATKQNTIQEVDSDFVFFQVCCCWDCPLIKNNTMSASTLQYITSSGQQCTRRVCSSITRH